VQHRDWKTVKFFNDVCVRALTSQNTRFFGCHVFHPGLLYYWVRYWEEQYTVFRGHVVESYVPSDPSGRPLRRQTVLSDKPKLHSVINASEVGEYAPSLPKGYTGCDQTFDYGCQPPYGQYVHFYGKQKPWSGEKHINTNSYGHKLWYNTLYELSKRLNLGITPENVKQKLRGQSSFGYMPTYWDMALVSLI
jgi:hypothetical protein